VNDIAFATKSKLEGKELVQAYFGGTALLAPFLVQVPFSL